MGKEGGRAVGRERGCGRQEPGPDWQADKRKEGWYMGVGISKSREREKERE